MGSTKKKAAKTPTRNKPATRASTNPKLEVALRLAAEQGDAAAVKRALAGGASVASADRVTGYTALHYAAVQGHAAVVKLLIGAGAPIEAQLKAAHTTPLGCAVDERRHDALRALLDAGARTDVLYGRTQMSPLHNAAINEDLRSVSLLLAAGANPDLPSKGRRTPLEQVVSMAISLDRKKVGPIVKALLAAGADRARGAKAIPRYSDGVADEAAYLVKLFGAR